MEVGFIGLGNMGFPMACRLVQENDDVVLPSTRGRGVRPDGDEPLRAPRGSWGLAMTVSTRSATSFGGQGRRAATHVSRITAFS